MGVAIYWAEGLGLVVAWFLCRQVVPASAIFSVPFPKRATEDQHGDKDVPANIPVLDDQPADAGTDPDRLLNISLHSHGHSSSRRDYSAVVWAAW